MDIKPGAFIPAPKVASSFIQFRRNTNVQTVKDQGLFLRLVKAAFISPRKMLRNNLKDFNITDEQVLNKRAQQLSFNDFVVLANSL
jgi:16S rRNA (adenine1518-N6/adenine1519-N6)-dimethyltransferase